MASRRAERRRHVARSCTGKQAHRTEEEALRHMWHHLARFGEKKHPYRCVHCKQFHIGAAPRIVTKRKPWLKPS